MKGEMIFGFVIEGRNGDSEWFRLYGPAQCRLWAMTLGPLPVAGYDEFRFKVDLFPNDGILANGYKDERHLVPEYHGA